MGMDVLGKDPKSRKGEYFRNNVWWWRPLWEYVVSVCDDVLTKQDAGEGHLNNGHEISARKVQQIAARLSELLTSGEVNRYEHEYRAALATLPLRPCEHCTGTGTRNDQSGKGKCNGCGGRSKREAWATHYPFSADNVREFAEFCAHSGGFRIH